jgi:hypothetical protein
VAKRTKAFWIRLSVLLFVLFVVVLWGIRDTWTRRERLAWDHTLDIAVVLVHVAGTEPADPTAMAAMTTRADALAARLAEEQRRYRSGAPAPFRFHVKGPVEANATAPAPASDSLGDLAKQAWDVSKWTDAIDADAGIVASHYDSRIYVMVKKATSDDRAFVEGRSEQGGRRGFVEVDLDAAMVDLALIVVAHETFHTLGATDKYDAQGRARFPEGFVDPNASPQYPQKRAEVMARNRPVAPGDERVPDSIDELGVGRVTAEEIRWSRAPSAQ